MIPGTFGTNSGKIMDLDFWMEFGIPDFPTIGALWDHMVPCRDPMGPYRDPMGPYTDPMGPCRDPMGPNEQYGTKWARPKWAQMGPNGQ